MVPKQGSCGSGCARQIQRDHEMTPAQRYEAAKRAWIAAHPEATPEQYQAAMRELARKAGL